MDATKPRRQMFIARLSTSNKPGADITKLLGGVIGGTLNQGELKLKDELEIRPGRSVEVGGKTEWVPITHGLCRASFLRKKN